jgi:hypothetical protein
VLHEDELHDEQPELPEEGAGLSPPLMPKRDNFFVTFLEAHFGHSMSGFEPMTSFSNSSWHSLHMYSNIGIFYFIKLIAQISA